MENAMINLNKKDLLIELKNINIIDVYENDNNS